MKDPILITGCARSGTSMTAGVLYHSGAFGGELTGATRHNKKGQFENNIIRDSIVKQILKGVGADPMGQNPLPDIEIFKYDAMPNAKSLVWERMRGKVVATLYAQGLKENIIWFYKGAKLCLMWPTWHKAFPDAKWIIVRREDTEIINSCMRTGFMARYHDNRGWQGWIDIHKQRFQEMKDAGLDVKEIYPKSMINGDFDAMKKVVKWAGLNWNSDKILDFITPALWSNIKRNVKEGV